jgi:UDP-N-acetylmuramoyl-tripeptide--D-alanyl-D-alanine ligase
MSTPCNRVEYSFSKLVDYQGEWSPNEQNIIINGTPVTLSTSSLALRMNALAVFSIASHLGVKPLSIQKQFESFQTPSGRGNVINMPNMMIINDSYNANLESARSGINNLASLSRKSRKIAVIGDMLELGEMDKEHHRVLGKHLSSKKVDAVFAYGNLTRHTIHAMNGASMFHQFYDDKTSLLTDLKEFLMDGDIVYVKGSRGMKMEEIISGLQN